MASHRGSHDDDDPYSKMFGSDAEGGGADAGGGSSGPSRPFNRDLSRGIGLTNAIRGSSAVLRQMSFDPSEAPMTDPNKVFKKEKTKAAVSGGESDTETRVHKHHGPGTGIKPAPAPPPKQGQGMGAIGAFAALQGGMMGQIVHGPAKSKKQMIEEKIKELEQEHIMKTMKPPIGIGAARQLSLEHSEGALDEDLHLVHAGLGKFATDESHSAHLYPHAHHVMGREHRHHGHRRHKRDRKISSEGHGTHGGSDSEEESRRQRREAQKAEKRKKKIEALQAANAAHEVQRKKDSSTEREGKKGMRQSESSAHESESDAGGLTMGPKSKVSFDSKAVVFSMGQDNDEPDVGGEPEERSSRKRSSKRPRGSPKIGRKRVGTEVKTEGEDIGLTFGAGGEGPDEEADRDRFEMADHRMAKLKISKSASSHILKVKNRARDPRTRYDSHTDGGYTTDEKEIYKGVYGKTLKFDSTPHEIFVEMDELNHETKEWVEQCRWVKYEERREPGSERWGRPHVSSLDFHSLVNLRQSLDKGVIMLDFEGKDFTNIAFKLAQEFVTVTDLPEENKTSLLRMLLYEHSFVESGLKIGAAAFSGTQFPAPPKKASGTGMKKTFTQKSFANLLTMDAPTGGNKPGQKKGLGRVATSIGFGKKDSMMEMMEEGVNGGMGADGGVPDFQALYAMAAQNAKVSTIAGRLKEGTEGTMVLVGRWKPVITPICGFMRLAEGIYMPDMMEVNIPIRFIFVFLVPIESRQDPHGVGRAFGTLMANPSFHNECYKIQGKRELLSAMNDFLDESVVLPPGDWDSKNLISLSEIQSLRDAKKKRAEEKENKEQAEKEEKEGLSMTVGGAGAGGNGSGDDKKDKKNEGDKKDDEGGDDGEYDPMQIKTFKLRGKNFPRPWAGIAGDIRKRAPFFLSDFVDGLNGQALAAMIFIYFAALSGAIAFGGLTATKSDNLIGIPETLITSCVAGSLFALFSGNPMIITGVTGPILLYDEALFSMSDSFGVDFLPWRVWVGVWIVIIALLVSLFQGAVLVKHFTKFTKDIFASLVALLFIFEALRKLSVIFANHPLGTTDFYVRSNNMTDYCDLDVTNMTSSDGEAVGGGKMDTTPNTALLSMILMFGTFGIGYYLRIFRNSHYFGRTVRRALGDFGVPIAIAIMVGVDYAAGDGLTEKLKVPDGLALTSPDKRGWLIDPFTGLPGWAPFLAVVPGLLLFMVLFIETEICELLMLEKTSRKGGGLHWDIVLLCLINLLCAIFGGPWICSATVRACAHASALTVMSTNHAPGEAPHVVEVKDQRLSALLVSILLGISVLLSSVLKQVPFSILFGVFLYMGVSSIGSIQLMDRITLLIVPVKHHGNTNYVKRVKTWKMHLYTLIQAGGLGVLWAVKSSPIALFFPFFVVLMVPLRMSLKWIFTPDELENLDGKKAGSTVKDEPDFYEQGIGG